MDSYQNHRKLAINLPIQRISQSNWKHRKRSQPYQLRCPNPISQEDFGDNYVAVTIRNLLLREKSPYPNSKEGRFSKRRREGDKLGAMSPCRRLGPVENGDPDSRYLGSAEDSTPPMQGLDRLMHEVSSGGTGSVARVWPSRACKHDRVRMSPSAVDRVCGAVSSSGSGMARRGKRPLEASLTTRIDLAPGAFLHFHFSHLTALWPSFCCRSGI